jgi:hypothetical protein
MSTFKIDSVILGIAVLVLGYLIYNNSKNKTTSSMKTQYETNSANPAPSSLGEDSYASANGVNTTTYGMTKAKLDNPSSLLPNDTNSQWASLNPSGNGPLKSVNLLQAGALIGINTIGSSLRNANLQLRSDPPNPQGSVGPWNNSTIQPDTSRKPLEIGGQL